MTIRVDRVVLIAVAGDSGCGKSTFLQRLTDLFGEEFMTVICLDDYHSLDRKQRKVQGVTALNPKANNFDLMYEQIKMLKEGKAIDKPIYNHETGELDPPERVEPNKVVVIEGLHPLYDERMRSLIDFGVYLDISDEVKVNWKIQRDMAERGHTYDDVIAAINASSGSSACCTGIARISTPRDAKACQTILFDGNSSSGITILSPA